MFKRMVDNITSKEFWKDLAEGIWWVFIWPTLLVNALGFALFLPAYLIYLIVKPVVGG